MAITFSSAPKLAVDILHVLLASLHPLFTKKKHYFKVLHHQNKVVQPLMAKISLIRLEKKNNLRQHTVSSSHNMHVKYSKQLTKYCLNLDNAFCANCQGRYNTWMELLLRIFIFGHLWNFLKNCITFIQALIKKITQIS